MIRLEYMFGLLTCSFHKHSEFVVFLNYCFNFQSAGHAKWEKADILEMTVDYLKKLRALRGELNFDLGFTS